MKRQVEYHRFFEKMLSKIASQMGGLTKHSQCRYINELITTLNLGVVKISILLFYRRLFTVRPFKVANTLMIVLVASWAISFSSAMAAQCSPPNYFWEAFEVDYEGHCIQVFKMYEGLAWSDLFLDILVLSFPIPIVASLHLSWRAKIKVLDILLLGAVWVHNEDSLWTS